MPYLTKIVILHNVNHSDINTTAYISTNHNNGVTLAQAECPMLYSGQINLHKSLLKTAGGDSQSYSVIKNGSGFMTNSYPTAPDTGLRTNSTVLTFVENDRFCVSWTDGGLTFAKTCESVACGVYN